MSQRRLRVAFMMFLLMCCTSLAQAKTVITGAGATFPYPLYIKWFSDYEKIDPSVSFSYKPVGSGTGIRQLLGGSIDFCAADTLPTDKQLRSAPGRILHIPTVVGGVALVYNLPGMPNGLKLTPDVVAAIFLGKITRWNDLRIGEINRNLKLPTQKIIVVHRSDASGTTGIFTEYLTAVSERWRNGVGNGIAVPWPIGIGRPGNQGVTEQVQKTPYAIGYVELAYAREAALSVASIRNRNGRFITPDFRTFREAIAHSSISNFDSRRVSLVNQPGENSYPIVGLTWLLVYQQQKDPVKGKKLVQFLEWALTKGQGIAPFMLYAPVPANIAEIARKSIRTIHY